MRELSWEGLAAYRARVRGSLLGAALGDALGRPVEGLSLTAIRSAYGETGLTEPVKGPDGRTGLVGDGTRMALFTAEGWYYGYRRMQAKGIGGAEVALVFDSYLRWLDTQELPGPPPSDGSRHRIGWLRNEPWLYERRSPGTATLAGLRERYEPDPRGPVDGSPGPVNPDSKGAGALVRSAPFGFTEGQPKASFELAARCARITHGHPTGYLAAGTFAAMVSHLVSGTTPAEAVRLSLELLAEFPGHQETTAALRRAVALAAEGPATPETVESLQGGWVAEGVLAVAVYALLAPTEQWKYRTPVESALLLAVNQSGDSGSAGLVCGSLLGAAHGDGLLPPEWLAQVEGRGTVATLADDFASLVHPGERRPWVY